MEALKALLVGQKQQKARQRGWGRGPFSHKAVVMRRGRETAISGSAGTGPLAAFPSMRQHKKGSQSGDGPNTPAPSSVVMLRACGASSTPRLIRFIPDVSGMLDRPAKPDDDLRDCGVVTRICTYAKLLRGARRPRFCLGTLRPLKKRGRGECRVLDAPAASCALLG